MTPNPRSKVGLEGGITDVCFIRKTNHHFLRILLAGWPKVRSYADV